MSVDSILAAGRAAAAARMRDICQITRPGDGTPVFDPATGQYVDPEPILIYEGPCRIPVGGSGNASGGITKNGAADQAFGVGEYPLDLPATGDSLNVTSGMTVTYLTSTDNPMLEGMVFGITEPLLLSQATKQRFKIKTAVSQ